LPCKSGKTWYAKVSRIRFAPTGPRFSKTCFPPAAARATIVLPNFGRSYSAAGEKKNKDRCKTHLVNVKSKAGKGLTKKRAGSMAGMPV